MNSEGKNIGEQLKRCSMILGIVMSLEISVLPLLASGHIFIGAKMNVGQGSFFSGMEAFVIACLSDLGIVLCTATLLIMSSFLPRGIRQQEREGENKYQ